MKNYAIAFACWLAYAVAKKQGWIDPLPDSPAWVSWLLCGFLAVFALAWAGFVIWGRKIASGKKR